MENQRQFALIGAALGWGALWHETEQGPDILKESGLLAEMQHQGAQVKWQATVYPEKKAKDHHLTDYHLKQAQIVEMSLRLAKSVKAALLEQHFPIVLGGDHSIAVGTWSGVTTTLNATKNFGLLWLDAHMDAHTLATTPSFTVHGMPVAILLGHGEKALTHLLEQSPKIIPENLVLLGVRSFEEGEAKLLKQLKVRIFFMEEIWDRGLEAVFTEALAIVSRAPGGFGMSLDLDVFDPTFVPGIGSPVPGGLVPDTLLPYLKTVFQHPQLKALEIAEFNPMLDKQDLTVNLTKKIVTSLIA